MKDFFNKNIKWIILSLCLFIFGILVYELLKNNLYNFDEAVYSFIISFKSEWLTVFFGTITFLASPAFLIVFSILVFFVFKNKKYGVFSLLNLIFIVIFNQILKHIFERSRPFDWMIIKETGYSFPSGHAMVSMGFYGMFIYLVWRCDIKKTYKIIFTIIFGILAILICISRIYLGVHYASDIIAGFVISVSYLIIAISALEYYLKKRNS